MWYRDGEKIEIEDEIELALNSATDFGLKAATGAALKVGAERGVLKFIPKGTSAGLLANIAFVGIENIIEQGVSVLNLFRAET